MLSSPPRRCHSEPTQSAWESLGKTLALSCPLGYADNGKPYFEIATLPLAARNDTGGCCDKQQGGKAPYFLWLLQKTMKKGEIYGTDYF